MKIPNSNVKKFLLLVFLFFSFTSFTNSQTYRLFGIITDSRTNEALPFVTIKEAGTNYGTTSDADGKYFIRLNPGAAKIIFSYIGYFSDTINVFIEDSDIERNIELRPSEIFTEAIDVFGEDPAYEIIRNAIKYKKQFQLKLREYEYDAYSKFVIRSNQSPVTVTPNDSNEMKILALMESESKGYFRKPDLFKQVIESKRESANTMRGIAIPLIVNFYDEKIDLNEFKIPGPLGDDAFDNYEYKLTGTTSIDSLIIYKIDVINVSNNRPLFFGEIYISDSIYSLMRVDLNTNDAAKLRAIDNINFKQKFSQYIDPGNNLYWMPSDIQIYADGSFAGLLKFKAEVYTVVSDYELNKKAPAGIFDEFIIKVLPDAKKDTSYWYSKQVIKNTEEERKAYNEIEADIRKRERSINIGLTSINYGRHYFSYPLNFYRFNRVEGSHLEFNLDYFGDQFRNNASSMIGYGLSDKKMKYKLSYTHRFFGDRSLRVSGSLFRNLNPLSYNLSGFGGFYNSMTSLFDKKDNLDYYYASGYGLSVDYRYIPQLRLGLEFEQEKQNTAYKNTNYSIRKSDEPFKDNPPVNDAFQRVLTIRSTIDPNKFRGIDWGDGDISRFRVTRFPQLRLSFSYSGKDLFNSTYEYRKYSGEISGRNYVNELLNVRYTMGAEIFNGSVPYQSLGYFDANTGTIDSPRGFKAMKYREFLGDKIYYFNFENNFGKFLWAGVPFLSRMNLIFFFNAAKSEISNSNYELSSFKDFQSTNGIYSEAGIGISRILDLFRIDFAWRLNNLYKGTDRFFIGISMDSF
jgi:hypothetical protein